MNLAVFFSPAQLAAVNPPVEDVYIVIDVIRATTSLAAMFDRGAARVLIADTVEQAREARRLLPERLLCGERHALPPPDFDYGNSPAQFLRLNLQGRELVLTTTNGTRAFFACPEESIRLAGSFYNAQAVATHALQKARAQGGAITIVCAAERGYFALDDSVCAGYLAQEIMQQEPEIEIHESVLAATALYQSYPQQTLLEVCRSARSVKDIGLGEDLKYCLSHNISESVPSVVGRDTQTGLFILERG